MTEFQKLEIEKVSDVWTYKVVNPLGYNIRICYLSFSWMKKWQKFYCFRNFLQKHKIAILSLQ